MRSRDPMAMALGLARQALGYVSPNPAVGAVIVREGRVVATGRTQPPGQAHAEVVALRKAGDLARGATMYVSLEPCSHYGRTPPCVDAIIAAGIARVVVAVPDPNPRVAGTGIRRLREAGIQVEVETEYLDLAMEINAGFFKWISTGQPLVIAKYAMSLDGKIATRTGDARWISGEASRREAHRLRQQVDAVAVGKGTVVVDDPQLTTRLWPAPKGGLRHPLRVVLASEADLPLAAKVLSPEAPGRTLVVVAEEALVRHRDRVAAIEALGHEVVPLPSAPGGVDLRALLQVLGQREATSVMVEGGGTLLGSFFDLGLVDRVVAFIAPVVIGGSTAPGAVGGKGRATMAEVPRLRRLRVRRLGDDVMITGYLRWPIVPLPSV
jgi:diaminohydroxyphosphoribosylaminopyrimidine deaminase/5-amino-6-(5-phosphoribosylamino)uracil reductase